jgi:DNA polymerase III epsilon subunit-like protein
MPTRRFGLTHLNNHLLCAIDCETTGTQAGHHDLIQICVLPLDSDIRPVKDVRPFYMDIQPKRPENIDPEVMRKSRSKICHSSIHGVEAWAAYDLFEEWKKEITQAGILPLDKRIVPLAHNWPFDRDFIIDWMGWMSFDHHFDGRFRDTMVAASFANDRSDFHCEHLPYPKVELKYLTSLLHVDHENAHDALQDCLATAELYRRLCAQ